MDKTKKYKLEDLKNEKLITSCNVQCFENKTSSKLVIVNINKPDILPC